MPTFNPEVKKVLNKVPIVKNMIIQTFFIWRGLFKWSKWSLYQFYFFLVNTRSSLIKSHGSIRKNPAVKSVIFLMPKYFMPETLCGTTEELILCFKELCPDVLVECIYFDEEKFINNKESYLKHIIEVHPSHFVYLYGPNLKFSLKFDQLQVFLRRLDSYKIILSTDSIRLGHSYFLNKVKNNVDMIVGLDASLRFSSKNSKLIGPMPGVISRQTFERLIKPSLPVSRDIDILIAGGQYYNRLAIADFLQQNGLKVTWLGGKHGKDRISDDEYFSISSRAKIRLISLFTDDDLHIHMKAHVSEAAAAASLLFVNSSYPVSLYFEEGKEFISFASLEELLEKVKWYLSHDEDRIKISMAAHRRWIKNYSGGKFWQNILSQA